MSEHRPSRVVVLEGRTVGSAQPGERIEVTVYGDTTLHDRMHRVGQLSDRQHGIADRVATMHDHAGFEPAQAGSYAPRGWVHGHEDDQEESEAITAFRRLLGGCSPHYAWVLHSMCLGQHPGVAWLATLQSALDWCGDQWGVERG